MGNLEGIFRGFFLTHRTKAQKFRGKFRSIFVRKFVARKKSFVQNSLCRCATLMFCTGKGRFPKHLLRKTKGRNQIISLKPYKLLFSNLSFPGGGGEIRQSSSQPCDWKVSRRGPRLLRSCLCAEIPHGILPRQTSKKFASEPPKLLRSPSRSGSMRKLVGALS